MAKRGGYPGGMMGMPGNMNNLMKQAQKLTVDDFPPEERDSS